MRLAPHYAAVLDANAIIGLIKGECLETARQLFTTVLVPPLVVAEVAEPEVRAAVDAALAVWLVTAAPAGNTLAEVASVVPTSADAEAVALALDRAPAYLVTNDKRLISRAWRLGVPSIERVALVRIMVEEGLLPAAMPVLDLMRARGYGIHEPVYQATLRAVGE